MNEDSKGVAQRCLNAAHEGSLSFPQIVEMLIAAGFESYVVDYRRNCQIYYMPDGGAVELAMKHVGGRVAEHFNIAQVQSLVSWAQANGPDYRYSVFCERMRDAGCAGYFVSFLGRRVVYYGRTGEAHVELFPD